MMLVLNIECFKIRLCGVCWNKEQVKWGEFDCSIKLTPQNMWYIQHCSDTPHPMFELTPSVGLFEQ